MTERQTAKQTVDPRDSRHSESESLVLDAEAAQLRKKRLDIRRAAMDLLARREHTLHELRDKLQQKFSHPRSSSLAHRKTSSYIDDESTAAEDEMAALAAKSLADHIEAVIQDLVEENLQSDDRFVESFINGCKAKGHGPQRISRDLSLKRVDTHLVDKYLDERDEYWLELAHSVYLKKFGDEQPESYKEKAKRMRFMQQRGFPVWMFDALL